MNTPDGQPPSLPGNSTPAAGSGQKYLFWILIAGINALVIISVILVAVLWHMGFFNPKPAVDSPPAMQQTDQPAGQPADRTVVRPVVRPTVSQEVSLTTNSALPSPVLQILSGNLNVLDGKSLKMAGAEQIESGDGYLKINDSESLRIRGELTLSAWFNATSYEKSMAVICRPQNGPPWTYPFVTWMIRVNTDTRVETNVGDRSGYADPGWFVPQLKPGLWYHVVLSFDGQRLTLYLNGSAITSRASGNPQFARSIGYTPGKPILIGADGSEPPVGDIFQGSIDDVRVYNEALGAPEVQSLFDESAKKYGASR